MGNTFKVVVIVLLALIAFFLAKIVFGFKKKVGKFSDFTGCRQREEKIISSLCLYKIISYKFSRIKISCLSFSLNSYPV